jgi:glycosyltransferase involved in cell wall biosynthesis
MDLVTVVIPTLNRPAPLSRALQSILRQSLPSDVEVEVVVVDNSPDGSAREIVENYRSLHGHHINYVQEIQTGVASARNRGVRTASGRWIAFLDDDEEAREDWIKELVTVARTTNADAIFGPIDAKSEGSTNIGGFERYFSRRIPRTDGADITDLMAYLGTNNSMFDRARCLSEAAPFDVDLNSSGGEDSLLLKKLADKNRRFAWAAKARVVEWVPDRRLSWDYVRKRKFLSGQIRVLVLHKLRPPKWLNVAAWMAVGLVQFTIAGAATLILRPLDKARSERASVICYAGLGKMFWMPKFRLALYGSGLVS